MYTRDKGNQKIAVLETRLKENLTLWDKLNIDKAQKYVYKSDSKRSKDFLVDRSKWANMIKPRNVV